MILSKKPRTINIYLKFNIKPGLQKYYIRQRQFPIDSRFP